MQVTKLEQELNNTSYPIYLLYGEEKYLLENIVNKIRKSFSNKEGQLQERYKLLLVR